ncbi:unnamed protein product [Clonostachys solani]|uniref:Choline transport protein n=1 Tax=Clonostachys solani TaxID=160281 RepID=A0A9N9ZIG6_9HYPO|nr:unnamed protein product [Clonostachys solani]
MDNHNSYVAEPSKAGVLLDDDAARLAAMGHKEEMPRQFSRLAALSFAFGITNSWVGQSATFPYPLLCGGGPGVFFSLILSGIACWFITLGLAELASAYPTSGGQYHFAYCVASKRSRVPIAFVTGWVSLLAWCLLTAASTIYAAQMIAALATMYNPSYESTAWQTYLIYILIIIVVTAVLCFLPRQVPLIEKILFFASLLAFIVFFISVLAMSKEKTPASQVFTKWENQSGWPDGFSFILATGTAMYCYIGTDAVIHLAEEIPHPGKNIPQVMNMTMGMGIFTALLWTVAFLFSVPDYAAIGGAALPLNEILSRALSHPSLATFYICWFLFIYVGCAFSNLATVGRLAWAFARDGGMPASESLAKIHPVFPMPVNATIACSIFIIAYGAIYCGSTQAFNSFLNSSILFINLSYAIPQGIAVWRGRDNVLPEREMRLGRFGTFCNAFSVVWVSVYIVLFCFPTTANTSAQTMNYVSAVTAGCFLIIAVVWFSGKNKTFKGPNMPESLVANIDIIDGVDTRIERTKSGVSSEGKKV